MHVIITDPFQAAINDFHRARQHAAWEAVFARLTNQPVSLLAYDEIAARLKVTGRSARGVRSIPVAAIVGSVGRYADFTRSFLPRSGTEAQRWASVKAAGPLQELPPIEVYQVGDAYFVLDGNHRVSIARQEGLTHLDAVVTEITTRVPLAAGDSPDALIRKAEYAAFLEYTQIDRLRPQADLRVSEPGQYRHLENHIEVHRYFLEEELGEELPFATAVCRWYDKAYLPLVAAIRERGLLRYFPDRTETDLYIWLGAHQAALRRELGLELAPEAAAGKLAPRLHRRASEGGLRGWWQRVRGQDATRPPAGWQQERILARYSSRLFADILLVATAEVAFAQAVHIASREKATLHVSSPAGSPWTEAELSNRCQGQGVAVEAIAAVSVEKMCQRASLVDLLVCDRTIAAAESTPLSHCSCPIFICGPEPAASRRVLLVPGGGPVPQAATFAATYLAERWQSELVVATGGSPEEAEAVHAYLSLHEVEAHRVPVTTATAAAYAALAAAGACDLVVLAARASDGAPGLAELLNAWPGAILACP